MRRRVAAGAVAIVLSVLSAQVLCGADSHRYVAVFADGAILEGDKLFSWNDSRSSPTLEGVKLLDPANPARWIRNRLLRDKAYRYSAGSYIEFVGGDRLPGKLVSAVFEGRGKAPSMLLVDTEEAFARPGRIARKYIRVLPSKVQRIVWRSGRRQVLTPGVAYLLNGRSIAFRRLRWGTGSVSLLHGDGVTEVAFGQLAELHPVTGDPWESYYDDLAVLNPGLDEPLLRVETIDGLIATASRSRFHALAFTSLQEQERYQRIRASLLGQLKNIPNHEKAFKQRIEALEKKLEKELKDQAEALGAGGREEKKVVAVTDRLLSQMEKRHQQRMKTHDRLTVNLEKTRLRQLKKLPADQQKVQLDAFRKDRLRQRARIEKQNAEEALRTRQQRQQQDQRSIERIRALKAAQQKRVKKSKTADQLIQRVEEYNNWLGAMQRVREREEALRGDRGSPDTWQHMVQPAWSLDPLWAPFNRIHTCSFFRPDEVPLSRFTPALFKEHHYLAKSAGWRLDRNARNGFLASAGRGYGWGYSTHAYSELHFDLAPLVTGFRTSLGLDSQVGEGGCIVGRVFLGSVESKPLYQSPFLVGSYQSVDTGRLAVPPAAGERRRLVLQADTAHAEGISGVDPFDIRDIADWLEPVLYLDRNRLGAIAAERVRRNIPAWRNWNLAISERSKLNWKIVLETKGEEYFFPALSLQGDPLVLSRKLELAAGQQWLRVDVSPVNAVHPNPAILEVRVDGKVLQPAGLPGRQPWQMGPVPLLYDLGINKDGPVAVEVSQRPGGEFICWRELSISASPPAVYELSALLGETGGENVRLNRAIARVVKSSRLGFEEKKTALQLYQKGAEINYAKQSRDAKPRLLGRKDLWKATASHFSPNADTPRNAIDGNPDTRWTSSFHQQPGLWFTLEFPGPTFIGGVRLMTPGSNDFPASYEVSVSLDGLNWSAVLAKGNGTSPITQAKWPGLEAKFLRIVQTGKKNLWWSIDEIEVLEPSTIDVVASVLLGESWRGTDEDLALLKKLPTLETVYFSGKSPNSEQARLDLADGLQGVTFKSFARVPSYSGPPCSFKVINQTKETLKIIWIGMSSKDQPRPDLAPGKSWVCGSFIGHRWEARIGDRPVGFYVVEPGFNWIVKDPE